jgi:hypothetical protein
MMSSTDDADEVGYYLREKYPEEFGGEDKLLVIHTDKKGEVSLNKLGTIKSDLGFLRERMDGIEEEMLGFLGLMEEKIKEEGKKGRENNQKRTECLSSGCCCSSSSSRCHFNNLRSLLLYICAHTNKSLRKSPVW